MTTNSAGLPQRLLTAQDVAELLGVTEQTLRNWRNEGRGPAFVRVEGRLIRYRQSDLDDYINARTECAA